MGLTHPADLSAWRREHEQAHRLRHVKARLLRADRTASAPSWTLTRGSDRPRVLAVLEATTPTSLASVMRPLCGLDPRNIAVLSQSPVTKLLPRADWTTHQVHTEGFEQSLRGIEAVLAIGHFLPIGDAVFTWAARHEAAFHVVQHGLLTPLAPPLPPNAHLLAWSQADADFWTSGRSDVQTTVVGSQLLHEVATGTRATPANDATPIYLGQLHGAELPRAAFARSAYRFCRETGATYRPHPSEKDKVSRLIHAAWERRGIIIDRSTTPLAHLDRPVVSAFSTGVLEAAARGLPAWVDFIDPPTWLTDFWGRYGMARWGTPPTPAPATDGTEPAAAIAQLLQSAW